MMRIKYVNFQGAKENMRKKYILKATAEIKTTLETSTPEDAKKLLESVLNEDGISADISNISLQEVSEIPESFKKQLYNKFTHGKG